MTAELRQRVGGYSIYAILLSNRLNVVQVPDPNICRQLNLSRRNVNPKDVLHLELVTAGLNHVSHLIRSSV